MSHNAFQIWIVKSPSRKTYWKIDQKLANSIISISCHGGPIKAKIFASAMKKLQDFYKLLYFLKSNRDYKLISCFKCMPLILRTHLKSILFNNSEIHDSSLTPWIPLHRRGPQIRISQAIAVFATKKVGLTSLKLNKNLLHAIYVFILSVNSIGTSTNKKQKQNKNSRPWSSISSQSWLKWFPLKSLLKWSIMYVCSICLKVEIAKKKKKTMVYAFHQFSSSVTIIYRKPFSLFLKAQFIYLCLPKQQKINEHTWHKAS